MYDARMEDNAQPPDAPAARLTYQDFLLLPADGRRHEIIDGKHLVTPSPNRRHQVLVGRLYFEIERFLREHHGTGSMFVAPFDVVLTRWDVVAPDLLFVADDQADIVTDSNVQGAPALVIEIVSPATRRTDEHDKRKLFDRCGVREYWLVDPEREMVSIHRRAAGGFFPRVAERTREGHDVLTTPVLPRLTIALSDLFA
jgi:Uma2 family endonuclease